MRALLAAAASLTLAVLVGLPPLAHAQAVVALEADFDTGADGFTYADDTFRGTSEPGYASGALDPTGFSGGGLGVTLGGLDNNSITDMSGGWSRTFTVASSGEYEVSFRYELVQQPDYESDEFSQVVVSLDGTPLPGLGSDYVAQISGNGNGGSVRTTGWALYQRNVGTLSAGSHTLVVGGYNNKKTSASESTSISIDDVRVATPEPPNPWAQTLVDDLDDVRFKQNVVTLVNFGSRHWSQQGNLDAGDWIQAQLESYGYTVERHTYLFQGIPRDNVYATKVGTVNPDQMYIVSAHYDSINLEAGSQVFSPGADDDGAGTALVLEVARVFGPPGVTTEKSIRFALWNNEETGLNGSSAYVADRQGQQGIESPPSSGLYPEPTWLGIIQHDMIMFDHGLPPGPTQIATADIDIEYQASSTFAGEAFALASAAFDANVLFATDYPAEVGSNMNFTDSVPFRNYTAAISIRENQRVAEIGNGSNPHWHQNSDVVATYSDADFRLGFNAAQTTVGVLAELTGATVGGTSVCGNSVVESGEDCDDGNTAGGDCCSTSCQFEVVGAGCDDSDACTASDTCDGAGSCLSGSPLICDDGLFCNGAESCDSALGCQVGAPPTVDDGISCTIDSCDEGTDTIAHAPSDALCDNGLFCDGAETCDAALDCQAGTAPSIDDGVSCTADSCDEASDAVVHTPIDAVCDNGLFCDGPETCDAVLDCQAGSAPSVDDGVGCTVDSCGEATDTVVNAPSDGLCDNSLFCDGAETCDAALDCQAGTAPALDDGVSCTADSCDEAADTIVHAPSDAVCDNGLFCDGAETCDAALDCQAGPPPSVDDGVSCTADSCDEAADTIVHAPSDAVCDTGLFCDGTETCDGTLDCQAGTAPSVDDGVSCTADSCDEAADALVHTPSDAFCDNGLFCDGAETCDPALDCQAGTAPSIDDGVSCTADSCNEAADTVVHAPSDGLCDNGLFCDGAETCDATLDCQAGSAPALDDGVSCTADSCDEAGDTIVHTPTDAVCDNGLFCDGTETCNAVLDCQAGSAPSVDDGVGCTVDSCDEATDSVVNAPSDGLCDNSLFCDGTETCDAVLDCQPGTAPPVDDGVSCTADSCDEAAETIVHAPNDSLCGNGLFCDGTETCDAVLDCQAGPPPSVDDGVSCTADSCDEAAEAIVHTPTDAVCDNGLFCDGPETCDAVLGCQAGSAPSIDDGVSCTVDSCDEAADSLVHAPSDALCDNGLFCDGAETCDAALDCQAGTAPPLDDGVSCTTDSCDEVADTVVHTPTDTACDNGLFCDGTETCDAALDCQAGTAPPLDDGVSCTTDSCDEVADTVVHTPTDTACDNGLFCDGTETCDATLDCQAGTAPLVDDGVSCTTDSCDEASDALVHTPVDAVCDNGLFCDGSETCDPALDCQVGTAPSVDDGVGCTVDSCDEAGDTIVHTPTDAVCDNGLFCDGTETCDAVLDCQAGTAPSVDDGVSCTTDSCDEASDALVHTPTDAVCDNGLFCDGTETCDAALDCQAGTAPLVDDGVSCTADSCDEAADTVVHAPSDAPCDNGLFCDGAETCDAVLDCQAGTAPAVDDGVSCTTDSCDEASDALVHTPVDAVCDNGLFCDGSETCDPALDCQAGTAPSVDDGVSCTADSCDEAGDTIVHTPTDAVCDNGLFCDGPETCDAVLDCQAGTAPSVDDGVSCTTDSCDEASDALVHTPTDAVCDNGLFCDGAETCDGVLDCQAGSAPPVDDGVGCTVDSCDEATDSVVNAPSDGLCDNSLFCDGAETCDAALDCQAGPPPSVDDGVGCTSDSCDEVADTIVHSPVDALCENGLFCDGSETCDPALDCQVGTAPSVDDGVGCTVDSCDEAGDTIVHAPSDAVCDNGLFCDGAETCDAALDCQAGIAPALDDGVGCTGDSCDEAADAIVHAPNDALCDNGFFCDGTETCDAALDCQAGTTPALDDGVSCTSDSCDEAADAIVHNPSDAVCDNGLFCDGTETCDAVLDCQAGSAPSVDDGVACTVDSCDEATDSLVHAPSDGLCDNSLFCDGSETCDPALDCQAGTAPALDDGVSCTADSCDEAADTIVHAPSDAVCDNGLFCDGAETCDATLDCQAGTAPSVDDAVSCTADSCDEAADALVHTPNDAFCDNGLFCDGAETCDPALDCQAGTAPSIDDGVSCTADSCDEGTDAIVHNPSDAVCDNGLFCDGAETCDATLDCQAGSAPALDDGVSCTADSCDEAADTVVHAPSDALCDNGLFCDGTETCDAALDCQAGTAPALDDGVGCTVDACDEATDSVVHAPSDAVCDNGLFCDGAETCDAALDCLAGTAPPLDDGVSCTADSCDEAADAIVHNPSDAVCDNGLFCDGPETCDATLDCQAGTAPALDDGVSCTADSCDEAGDAIVHAPTDALCDNGLFCDGAETCDAALDCQAGAAPSLDDGIGCTSDSCDEVADTIVHSPVDAVCDNGLFCDGAETCDAALDCQVGTTPALDDGVSCTSDSCDEAVDAIVHAPTDALCDNGLFCDGTETCDAALDCQVGTAPALDDGVSCTADSCDEAADAIVHAPSDAVCDNGLFCDGNETCDTVLDCQAGTAPALDDGVSCTADSCDEAADAIVHAPSDVVCDNGLFCDGAETCDAALDCQAGTAPALDDGIGCTSDSCDEAADAVVHTPSDALCDNGLFCDGAETCDAALDCQAGVAPSLDDGVSCTADSCDEAADAIVHAPSDAVCDNGLFCDGAETCDAALDCQAGPAPALDDGVSCTSDSCDEAADAIVHNPSDAVCDNGLFCDGAETCDAAFDCQAGAAPALDDGVSCTADSCDEGTDAIVHTPTDALCDNGLFCDGTETCDAALDCQAGTAPSVDDGVSCTLDSCDEATDSSVHTPNDVLCDNGLFCDGAETCDATLDCQAGTGPTLDDGVGCTADSCDEAADAIVHNPTDAVCDNGLFCDGAETCDAALDCQAGTAPPVDDGVSCTSDSCDEAADAVVHNPSDAVCDNGLFCDGAETCDAAFDCQAGPAPALDDGVSCTADSCDEGTDAIVHNPSDAVCDNGLFCDGAETCDAAFDCQAGAAPALDDGVSCTADSCDEGTDAIVHTPTDAVCDNGLFCDGTETCDAVLDCQAGTAPSVDDGVGCTVDSCDEATDTVVSAPSEGLCDNGLFCDGAETCDAALDCQAGTAPTVDDGVSCTADSCDEAADTVVHTPTDALCDNGLFCDGTETCDAALDCQVGTAPALDDGVSCTADSCDEAADAIVHAPSDAVCDNGLFCDGAETCDAALDCQAGTAPTVDDGVGCTADACDEAAETVVHTPSDALCDNGLYCDGAETCDSALDCLAGTAPALDDGVSCTTDSCDEAADTVVHTPSDAVCDNGLFCDGAETCDATLDCQAGTAPALDDGVSCTADSCDEAGDAIVHAPTDALCDNGLFCDGAETCDAALDCQAGAAPSLDDGIGCTSDSCDEVADTIIHAPSDALCDNGLFCDGSEICDAGLDCQAGSAPALDDGVSCTSDSCDEATDTVVHTPSDAVCDNGLFCDGTETCDTVLDCQAGTAPSVDDGVTCTADSCDEAADAVVHSPSDAVCDNGLFCDGNETCDTVLDCQAGTAPALDDGVSCTADSCDEAADAIVHAPSDVVCDNGLFCDGAETCDAALDCQSGSAPALDDGIACTADSCDEAADTVVHNPSDALCDNGLFCDGAETCDAALDCQAGAAPALDDGVSCTSDSCDEAADAIVHAPSDAVCDNGLFCDGAETCDPALDCQAGSAPALDDGIGCTADSCDEAADTVVHTPSDALCDNGLYCDGTETCDAALDCQAGVAPSLDDGVSCTADSCDEAADTVVHNPSDAVCDNGVYCDGTETCDAALDCQAGGDPCVGLLCDESADLCVGCFTDGDCADDANICTDEVCTGSECQAVPNTGPCDDGVGCTSGDACAGGACVGVPDDVLCDDGNACTDDMCDGLVGCQMVSNTDPCDDGDACTTGDECSAGACVGGVDACLPDGSCWLPSSVTLAGTLFEEPLSGAQDFTPGPGQTELAFVSELLVDENGNAEFGVRKNDPSTGVAGAYVISGEGGQDRHTVRVTLETVDLTGLADVELSVLATPLDSGNGFETADYLRISVLVVDSAGAGSELILVDTRGQDMDALGLTGLPFDLFSMALPADSVSAAVVLEGSRSGPSEEIHFDRIAFTTSGTTPGQEQLWIEAEAFDQWTASSSDGAEWLIAPEEVSPSDDVYTNALGMCNADGIPRYVQSLPDAGRIHKGDPFGTGPVVSYEFEIVQGGLYRIWVRAAAIDGRSDSFYLRVRETAGASWWRWNPRSDRYSGGMDGDLTDEWQGSGAFGICTAANPVSRCPNFGPMEEALAPGIYHLDISMREDGSALDAIVLDGAGTFSGADPTTP